MTFDKRYWLLIIPSVLFAGIASLCTFHMLSVYGLEIEAIYISRWFFERIGLLPGILFGMTILILGMISIPYLFRQNETISLYPSLIMGCIMTYTLLDAINDMAVILMQHEIYAFVHEITLILNYITYFFFT
jgi:hypothetical protein